MYKIMLADDEGIVIDSLKFVIEKEFGSDCVVEFAKTGRSVIELAERFRPDIAIMDIQMPGINGIEVIRELRNSGLDTVFIIMSAFDKFDYAKEAINLRVMEYLTKPMNRDKLVAVLKKAMHQIDAEREKRSNDLKVREKLETVVPIIENGLIYNILFQEHFEEDVQNYKNLLGITETYGYMLSVICGDEQQGNHMTNAVGTSVRLQNYYLTIRELIKEYFPGIVSSVMGNKIAVLVPCNQPRMEYNERIELIEKARELARKLRKITTISFRVGIGSIRELGQLVESYNESIDALVQSTGSVAHADDLPLNCRYEENYPIDLEREMFEAIEKGDVNTTAAKAGLFFEWMETTYPDNLLDIKLKVLEFALWAEHIAYLAGGLTYQFAARHDYLTFVVETDDMASLKQWFVEKLTGAGRHMMTKTQEQSVSVVTRARNYIDANFNRDLSLDEVSREVNISPYYFSKIFKDETGETFIEYLTQVRIAKAKDLLSHTNYSMKEICTMVGYADPNYFSRSFKKNVGVSPTEYKEGR